MLQLEQSPLPCYVDLKRESALLHILAGSYYRRILEHISDIPKSCSEISAECRIPISTVYRRIQFLHDQNLVDISGVISKEGKKYFLYKSKVKSIEVLFDTELTIKMILK